MAVCNANYEFIAVDIGDTGRNSDGGVFASSDFGIAMQQNIPEPEERLGTGFRFPYVLIGDEAFPLKENMMKPYPREVLNIKERIFNYRLSRGRRIIENTFGILAARFRIFRRPIIAREEVVINITKAAVALHNYLMNGRKFEADRFMYCPIGFVDADSSNGNMRNGLLRQEIQGYEGLAPMRRQLGSNNYTREAKSTREMFQDFFNSPHGQVPWQYQMVTSTQNTFDNDM